MLLAWAGHTKQQKKIEQTIEGTQSLDKLPVYLLARRFVLLNFFFDIVIIDLRCACSFSFEQSHSKYHSNDNSRSQSH